MSALGDYIHLYTSNYLKYGTNRRTPQKALDYSMSVINNRIMTNVKPISQSTIDELERRLKLNSDLETNKELDKAEK